ncbi:MAG: nitroreductase family protein [Chloroflexi bacterium]|jgi:nitroreductase|nr:nitroreductase family protein [Chloroflexota bacterium]
MTQILDYILQRRSIRKFTDAEVNRETILQILQAGMAAPSATNRQPWEFVVLTERKPLERLRRVLVLGRYHAPAVIVVCGNMRRALPGPARDFWVQDCSAATQNILLAATGLGLGAVWIGIHPIGMLKKGVSLAVGLPKHLIPLAAVYIGHPAETKPPRTQFDPRKVHWEQVGTISPADTEPE